MFYGYIQERRGRSRQQSRFVLLAKPVSLSAAPPVVARLFKFPRSEVMWPGKFGFCNKKVGFTFLGGVGTAADWPPFLVEMGVWLATLYWYHSVLIADTEVIGFYGITLVQIVCRASITLHNFSNIISIGGWDCITIISAVPCPIRLVSGTSNKQTRRKVDR